MTDDLTAGEFQAMTGLTAKALRLYAERGIVTPAWVDPGSGYRYYARQQLQHGATVDLLRRAQVPLAELASAPDFPFDRWRQTVALRRHLEDFSLAVAEKISTFDADDFIAHSTPAAAQDWVGIIVDLDLPEDAEGRVETFTGLAVDMPAIEVGLRDALTDLGAEPATVCWTAVPDTGVRNASGQMLLARSGGAGLDSAALARIEKAVHASTGSTVTAVAGTLPRRVEVTFAAASATEPTPVDEAAAGNLHLLAFEEHRARHHLTAIRPTARQVVHGPSLFTGDGGGAPMSVFDVQPG
ncbi:MULTISPECIES: MerR family transcriptional regulator [unclassified Cryobacterium]|uniref:MerR family transcriptional regulator n=1 Tax=unclassified Cryobacterium TaxID=2649013 RepID=UPI00106C8763|nr:MULTISPECIES: MerR family transcriptional regulator [unclassified Cryobacterium]TFC60858.1 MerR family transcriptional regulator [Cryobacterium sp. TMB1-7]TFC92367.1 MerR family transcriptional regulator [Cryobacterium sp. TMT4-31]